MARIRQKLFDGESSSDLAARMSAVMGSLMGGILKDNSRLRQFVRCTKKLDFLRAVNYFHLKYRPFLCGQGFLGYRHLHHA
jgi:hypothetical protein